MAINIVLLEFLNQVISDFKLKVWLFCHLCHHLGDTLKNNTWFSPITFSFRSQYFSYIHFSSSKRHSSNSEEHERKLPFEPQSYFHITFAKRLLYEI